MNKWKVTPSSGLAEGKLMKKKPRITCAFLIVGDVPLTYGWVQALVFGTLPKICYARRMTSYP
jgi:hypothetical protein